MSASVSAQGGGYSLALAARHLVAGPIGPREAMRETLATGIGERGRLVLFFASSLLLCATDPQVQANLDWYVGLARNSPGPDVALAVGLLATLLGLVLGAVYLSEVLALYGAARIAARRTLAFARARTIVALASWIAVLPVAIWLLAVRHLTAGAPGDLSQPPPTIALAVIGLYLAVCISEAAGLPLRRSLWVTLLAVAGWFGAAYGLVTGLESLTDTLRAYIIEVDIH